MLREHLRVSRLIGRNKHTASKLLRRILNLNNMSWSHSIWNTTFETCRFEPTATLLYRPAVTKGCWPQHKRHEFISEKYARCISVGSKCRNNEQYLRLPREEAPSSRGQLVDTGAFWRWVTVVVVVKNCPENFYLLPLRSRCLSLAPACIPGNRQDVPTYLRLLYLTVSIV